jgi:hypothetical protein
MDPKHFLFLSSSGLSPTNSTVLLEGDTASYYCSNKWFKVSAD